MSTQTDILEFIKGIPDELKALGDALVATKDFLNQLSDILPNESRTILVEILNLTSRQLRKDSDSFDSGGFGSRLPEIFIPPFSNDVFIVESSGAGVIGNVSYAVDGASTFNVHFSNPFVGGNTQSVQSNVDDILSILGDISNGNHTHARYVVLNRNGPFPKVQNDWRQCPKCQGMHFAGFPDFKGVCPAGGQHEQTGSFSYYQVFDSQPSGLVQDNWRSCPKCQGMHFAGFPDFKGVCPAGGQHEQTNSFAYVQTFGIPEGEHVQAGFKSCKKCQGFFFGPLHGVCPAGGEHDATGSFEYIARFS
jgi:ribosomal protein S27AE